MGVATSAVDVTARAVFGGDAPNRPPPGMTRPEQVFGDPLAALCAVARLHQVAADPAHLAHQLGLSASDPIGTDDLLRAARHLGLHAKRSRTRAERLTHTPLPALAIMAGPGGNAPPAICVLAQCDGHRVLLSTPGRAGGPAGVQTATAAPPLAGPRIEPLAEFASRWSGELILISIRARLVVPCHYDMFEFNTVTPDEFVGACEKLGQSFRVLGCGEKLVLTAGG